MHTRKKISTISYNTTDFLLSKLNELISSHTICDYMFIEHQPEEDELKVHKHLYIEPNTLIDTMDIQDYLTELDPLNLDKPLKCTNFQAVNDKHVDDWILYSEHCPAYLRWKGQSRVYTYCKEDFFFYDEDTFNRLYLHAYKASEFAMMQDRMANVKEVIKGTSSPMDAFTNGLVPLNLANSVNSVMFMQSDYERRTFRNGKEGHD